MDQALITNATEIIIVSGEGEGAGTSAVYTGARTARALKMRLAKERCNGDRWAIAKVLSHVNDYGHVYINLETGEHCR